MGVVIGLIDESRLFREGLRRICEDWPFQIGFEASSFDDFERRITADGALAPSPELVLIDTPQDGRELREQLVRVRDQFPDSRLVVLTDHMQLGRLAIALAAGIDGYLLKDVSAAALLQSLRLVLLGEKVFPTGLARLLVNGRIAAGGNFTSDDRGTEDLGLSEPERQLLQCLANGYSNRMIAHAQGLTESKVKGNLKTLLRKIQVQNRTQAAIWALNHGIGVDVADLMCRAEHASDQDSLPASDCRVGAAAPTEDAPATDGRGNVQCEDRLSESPSADGAGRAKPHGTAQQAVADPVDTVSTGNGRSRGGASGG